MYKIVDSTDNQFLGIEFVYESSVLSLNGFEFNIDKPPVHIGENVWRFFNSNYSIDAKQLNSNK